MLFERNKIIKNESIPSFSSDKVALFPSSGLLLFRTLNHIKSLILHAQLS